MIKDSVTSWHQKGVISLWRYLDNDPNFPGWHLYSDKEGLLSLLNLLRAFQDRDAASPTHRSINLSPVTQEIRNNAGKKGKITAPSKLRLSVESNDWIKEKTNNEVVISLGAERLQSLIEWLAKADAAFDSNFGEEPTLWFWGT